MDRFLKSIYIFFFNYPTKINFDSMKNRIYDEINMGAYCSE